MEYGDIDDADLNIRPNTVVTRAVALVDRSDQGKLPEIAAAGRGKLAEEIVRLAFASGIKVREDADLAELLIHFELDSPVPTEALMAVGEILAYVYKANNEPNPFAAILQERLDAK